MNLKIISLLGLIFAIALQAEPPPPPRYVNTRGLDGFNYWIIKKIVGDVDEILKKQGIDSAVCTFRPADGSEDLSYRELGKCLMKNFKAAANTPGSPGMIYTWIRDSKGQFHTVEINWRPPQGGLSQVLRQVFEMKFEKGLYAIREQISGQEASEKVNFSEFIVGSLQIILPKDPAALETLSMNGNEQVKRYLRRLESVSLKLNTTTRPKGEMIYSGPMTMQMKSPMGDSMTVNIQLTTNINVMLLDRPFFVKGQAITEGGILP